MRYLDLYISEYWKIHEKNRFGANEVCLFFLLLNEYTLNGKENSTECSDRKILLSSGLSYIHFVEARSKLTDVGLIGFDEIQGINTYHLLFKH